MLIEALLAAVIAGEPKQMHLKGQCAARLLAYSQEQKQSEEYQRLEASSRRTHTTQFDGTSTHRSAAPRRHATMRLPSISERPCPPFCSEPAAS